MIVLSFAIFLKFIVFYKISFLEITAVIIGVAWNKQPIIFSYRILFMSWVIFGYILTQYYLASMPGRLLAKTDNKIDTIKDLIDSGISRGGLKNTKIFFIGNKKFNNKSTSNELIDKLFENYNGFERIEYEKKLQDLISGKNKTMALSALMNSSSIPTKFDSRILRILPEALTTFPLGFPVWRGLPYLNDIDKDLQILIESGIISHFGNIETKHVFSKDNNDGKISDEYIKLNDLVPGFLILGIGYAVGYDNKKARDLVELDRLRAQGIAKSLINSSTANLTQKPKFQMTEETKSPADEKLRTDAICSNEIKSLTNSSCDSIFDVEKLDEPVYSMATMRIASLKKNRTKALNDIELDDLKNSTLAYAKQTSITNDNALEEVQPYLRSQMYSSKENLINSINAYKIGSYDLGISRSYQPTSGRSHSIDGISCPSKFTSRNADDERHRSSIGPFKAVSNANLNPFS
ncbi:hypothetical protein HCN44_004684 [Aphidius gifuensis]|uniref:Ionotropic receptor n=1 Tax=Aphidius gifuensis TaxID=684658 RepID=A0A834Y1I0_APHGI|nr:hypothetical protein HCN44_004684 [Aphidius gifuensis]